MILAFVFVTYIYKIYIQVSLHSSKLQKPNQGAQFFLLSPSPPAYHHWHLVSNWKRSAIKGAVTFPSTPGATRKVIMHSCIGLFGSPKKESLQTDHTGRQRKIDRLMVIPRSFLMLAWILSDTLFHPYLLSAKDCLTVKAELCQNELTARAIEGGDVKFLCEGLSIEVTQ